MADNVTLPPTGTGTADVIVATDKIGGVDYQRIKNAWGADGTATDTDATAAAAFPVRDIGVGAGASAQTTISSTSATVIAARAGRRAVLFLNLQTVAVYLDASGGTATTSHFRLDPGASCVLPIATAVTGITSAAYTASGDAKVHTIELY